MNAFGGRIVEQADRFGHGSFKIALVSNVERLANPFRQIVLVKMLINVV